MRILQIIQRPQLRGAEIFACQLAVHLSASGHELLVLTLFPGNAKLPYEVKLVALDRPEHKRLWDLAGLQQLANEIKKFRPDVVQANAGDTLRFAVLSRLLFRWRSVLIYRNANMVSGFVRGGIRMWLNRFLLLQADHIIAVSNSCRRDLIVNFNIPEEKTDVVEVGVEAADPGDFPADILHLRGNGPLLVSVAGFVPEKNHKGLLRIFQRLLQRFPDAVLLIAGTGKLEQTIKKLAVELDISASVRFLGVRNDVLSLLSGCDVLLLPSLVEGMPAVILESMAAGCPVVTYDVGGISEVVKNGVTGFLVQPEKEEEFNEKVTALLEDKTLAGSVISRAKECVHSRFENRMLAQKFTVVYNRLLHI